MFKNVCKWHGPSSGDYATHACSVAKMFLFAIYEMGREIYESCQMLKWTAYLVLIFPCSMGTPHHHQNEVVQGLGYGIQILQPLYTGALLCVLVVFNQGWKVPLSQL